MEKGIKKSIKIHLIAIILGIGIIQYWNILIHPNIPFKSESNQSIINQLNQSNQNSIIMKNSKLNQIKGNSIKENSKDAINIDALKIDLSKGKKDLLNKESSSFQKKSLYKGLENMDSESQKKFRSKIRRNLRNFCNQILGKDRSDAERMQSIKEFMKFYKENWKIQDFKIDNFSHSKNEIDRKDYIQLLDYLKSIIG